MENASKFSKEGDVPTAVWVVTRAGCDGDNSDAVRGAGRDYSWSLLRVLCLY